MSVFSVSSSRACYHKSFHDRARSRTARRSHGTAMRDDETRVGVLAQGRRRRRRRRRRYSTERRATERPSFSTTSPVALAPMWQYLYHNGTHYPRTCDGLLEKQCVRAYVRIVNPSVRYSKM